MKLKYKLDSLYTIKGVPLRYICLILSSIFLLLYFILGISSSSDLTLIKGTVKSARTAINNKTGVFQLNIELTNVEDTVFLQNYYVDIPSKIIWGISKKSLSNLTLQEKDRITIYSDKNENTHTLKSGKTGIMTYGLVVNGNEIIDKNKRKYLSFSISILATLSFLSVIAAFLVLLVDLTISSKKNKKQLGISSSVNEQLNHKFNSLEKYFRGKQIKDLTDSELKDYVELIDLYWIAKKEDSIAEKEYIKLLSIYPEHVTALFMFSQLLMSKNELERADVLLEKIYRLDNSYKNTFANIFKELEDEHRYSYWINK